MLYASQKMGVYTLTIYLIHEKCANIMLNHHLMLKVNVTSLNNFLIAKITCNCSLTSHKLFFTSVGKNMIK
jgi:hypothetical protein